MAREAGEMIEVRAGAVEARAFERIAAFGAYVGSPASICLEKPLGA
jgi:hypothetical protein